MDTLLKNHVIKEKLIESYKTSNWEIVVDSHLKRYTEQIESIIDNEDLDWDGLTVAANKLIDNPKVDIINIEDVCKLVLEDLVRQKERESGEFIPNFELI